MNTESSPSLQASLFPGAQEEVVFYEQPLSERIRAFLRLEHLFGQVLHHIAGETEWNSRGALSGLIEINDLLARFDLKAELIKELERHSQVLSGLKQNPKVDPARLRDTLSTVNELLGRLRSNQCQPAQCLRKDELVYAVKQRLPIPGGTCNFDLPAYHHWLSRPAAVRIQQLKNWISDLEIIRVGVERALGMVRNSAHPQFVVAGAGFYQQPVEPNVLCQLVRVGIAADLDVFPEISGGKHRFTIRFLEQRDTGQRPTQTAKDIEFELQCCNL
ncbi:MAG: cell division protein ZapD [Gammaproteobacteria bacterium]